MKIIQKNWKWILAIIIVLIIALRAYQRFAQEKPAVLERPLTQVETLSLVSGDLDPLSVACIAEPSLSIGVTPEASGTIERVLVNDGENVTKGQILLELDNIQQRVALQDAKVALDSAQLALQDVVNENDASAQSSFLAQTKKQQDILVEQARNTLFNTDLRAYPLDNPEDSTRPAPEVIGNYTCANEGQYNIEVYASGSDSGASYRYNGLESGTSTASTTTFGTDLGNCGLELVFPAGFKNNEDWIIPVPNTRSSQYFAVKKAYDQAIENRALALNQTEVSPEQIGQQQGRVAQARLRYELAADNLEKTRVRAKATGALEGFSVDQGNFVQSFSEIATIKTVDELELVAFISQDDKSTLNQGAVVSIGDITTEVISINAASNADTRRTRVVIAAPPELAIADGDQLNCAIERSGDTNVRNDGGVIVPLSAVSVIGSDTFVFSISDDMKAQSIGVTTGALLGTDVVIYGIDSGVIIRDARGIRPEQKIQIKEA